MARRNAFRRWAAPAWSTAVFVAFGSSLSGCASIQSDAVRKLVKAQGEHVDAAQRDAGAIVAATNQASEEWKQAIQLLDEAAEDADKIDGMHRLVFSSNKAVASLKGADAHSVTYLIGDLYLAKGAGLQQAVKDQFQADFDALAKLATHIKASWAQLKENSDALSAYADGTFLAGVDAAAVKALIVATRGDLDGIDELLQRSKQVNDALKKAAGAGVLAGSGASDAENYSRDLVDLLQRIKQ